MSRFGEYKEKKMQNPEFKKEYDALKSEFNTIQANTSCEPLPACPSSPAPHAQGQQS